MMNNTTDTNAHGVPLHRLVGRGDFALKDGTACRNAETHGSNVRFEYKNGFGWQTAYMPPDTECIPPNTEPSERGESQPN